MKVLAIDPGINGAFVVFDGGDYFTSTSMPISIAGKEKFVSYSGVRDILEQVKTQHGLIHVFLERAVSFGMGSKSAFTYGRGFEALVIALDVKGFPVTYVEPNRWSKEMHEGISSDLKGKAKSLIAVQRLFPQLVGSLPKRPKGGLHDGPIDALLIAGYGLRRLGIKTDDVGDFF